MLRVPLDVTFKDETGRTVALGDYFGQRPAILALVYYQCKMLCPEEIDGLVGALEMVKFNPGKDFNLIFVSIDPTETPAMAAKEKAFYLKRYGRPETANGWHFLTGQQPSIDALAAATGYGYTRVPGPDGKMTQFAHASAIQILTPTGKLAQGVRYRDVDGVDHDVSARVVVVAGGAWETPRLLLRSEIANSSDLVGRYLMYHFQTYTLGLFPFRLHAYRGRAVTHLHDDFLVPDADALAAARDAGLPYFRGGIVEHGGAGFPLLEAVYTGPGVHHSRTMLHSPMRDRMGRARRCRRATSRGRRVKDPCARAPAISTRERGGPAIRGSVRAGQYHRASAWRAGRSFIRSARHGPRAAIPPPRLRGRA